MAKVGLFLRGARGKFAGSVLQKGEKGTIIRENVKAANPQTQKQMLQRIAFATVSLASKYLLPIIGQTFEGRPNEKENRRAFLKANVTKLRNDFVKYNGLGNLPAASPDITSALPKGVSALVPNAYVVANGSLLLPDWLMIYRDRHNDLMTEESQDVRMTVHTGDVVNPATVLEMIGLHVGDQITACGILTRNGEENVIEFDNSLGDYVRYGKVAASRLVFDADEDWWAEQSVEITGVVEDDKASMLEAILACINTDKTDPVFKAAFTTWITEMLQMSPVAGDEGAFGIRLINGNAMDWINTGHILGDPAAEPWKLKAAGFFISNFSNGYWHYTNCELAEVAPGVVITRDNTYHGARYLTAQETYVKTTDENSDKFTRRGGDINAIS